MSYFWAVPYNKEYLQRLLTKRVRLGRKLPRFPVRSLGFDPDRQPDPAAAGATLPLGEDLHGHHGGIEPAGEAS